MPTPVPSQPDGCLPTPRVDAAYARAYWQQLATLHGTRVAPKRRSLLMQAAAVALAVLRVQSRQQFLDDLVTVIGKTIYVPLDFSQPVSETDAWRFMLLAAHEHCHVEQAERDSFLVFALRYLLSPKHRALYEAEAYATAFTLARQFDRLEDEVPSILARLQHYGLGAAGMAEAERALVQWHTHPPKLPLVG